ncbi:type VII secretion integral membrane protein EccD [Streptomyces sp. TRM75561]|nr:type VII secretion integral membrane protein EccD [Streptomyces sp. TRM75561]MDH3039153.1 type VII secretion integral membrane protein EccD [Streptomyces sp. TRM75561]
MVGARRRVDLAVPTDAAIAEYVPALLELVGEVEFDETFPPVWSLALPAAMPFPPEASLRECGVMDGATLYLKDAAEGEFDEPVVTDLEESVSQATEGAAEWGLRLRAHTTLVLGLLGFIAGFVTLAVIAGRGSELAVVGAGALFAALVLAGLVWQATRQGWSLPLGLRLIMVHSSVPMFAIGVAALSTAATSTATLPKAAGAGAVLGAVVALLALRHATTLMAVAITAVGLVLGTALAGTTLVETSAVVAVSMMTVLGAASKVSGHFAVLAGMPGGATGTQDAEAHVSHLVKRSRRLLAGMSVLGSLVTAASLAVLGSADQTFAVALACCLGLALVLRAGRLTVAAAVVPMVTAGTVGLSVTLTRAPGNFGYPDWAGAVVLLGAALSAIVLGLSRSFRTDDGPERPSWIDPLAGFLLVVSVPLAVGVFGVYAALLRFWQTS